MLQHVTDSAPTLSDLDALDQGLARIAFAPDGTIKRTNALFLALFDYRAWDLAGRSRQIFLPAEPDSFQHEPAIRQVFEDGIPFSGEVRRVKRDGSELWVDAIYVPIRGGEGDVAEIVVFLKDITARKLREADEGGQIAAINTSQAVIHFSLDGTILDANPLFLETMGYELSQIVGQHHRMFVDPAEAITADYAAFWSALSKGTHGSGEYRRLGRDGRAVWLRATYNPIFDASGRPFKVVKYAVDVSREKLLQADYEGQIAAIRKSQCVVTFAMDGTIVGANERFLEAVGYRMDEIEGRHHRMFVDPSHAHGLEYEIFWNDLTEGRHRSGEFKRIGRDGREIWLQATYNPVLDQDGKPFKVVKYATTVTREKLRQADHQGQIAAIHKSQCVVSFALDGTVLDANDNFLELTGYRLSEVRGQHHRMFVPAEAHDGAAYADFWSRLAAGRHCSGEFKRVCRDGREVWLQSSYNPIFDMNGRPFKVVKNAVDVTAEKLRQGDHEGQISAIRKSQCVVAFDMGGTILDANENFLQAMGYELSEIQGRHHSILVEPSLAESDQYRQFWQALAGGDHISAKFRRCGKDGREVWIQASYNPILDLNGRPFKIVKIATDITADVAIAADLSRARRAVVHDALTGLPNRTGLADFMRRELVSAESKLTVFYLDLDHFKPINDTFGHHVGDHVLREIAARLRLGLDEDQIVARVGGDEFVVAAPELTREAADALCTRLIALAKDPIRYETSSLNVGLSIGVAQSPVDSTDGEELLRHADVALYRSKGAGRGMHSFFSDAFDGVAYADRHLAHEMGFAIKAGQFEIFYRPRFTAEDHVLEAVETQIEWNHPERGPLAPEQILKLAEESGLIVPLGEWALRSACRSATAWPIITVSVGVSPVQFLSCDLPSIVGLALRESGLPASRLELRVAQGSVRCDIERMRSVLSELRRLGVRVVVEGRIVGEDATSGTAGLPVDDIVIDAKTRGDLERLGHASIADIVRLETALGFSAGSEGSPEAAAKVLTLRLNREAQLEAFLSASPRPAAAIASLFGGTAA